MDLSNQIRQHNMNEKRGPVKSELKLYDELMFACCDVDTYGAMVKQFTVNFDDTYCVLDIAIPALKIAIRVMGEVHGFSWAPCVADNVQKFELEALGWDVIDVWHDERPDLWL